MKVMDYELHTLTTGPEESRPSLQKLKGSVGMIPNLAAAMAESPTLIQSFVSVREAWQAGTFTPAERELLTLVNAVENECRYCRAIHSAFGLKAGLQPETIRALREKAAPGDPKLDALAAYARSVLRERGQVEPAATRAFFAAGYSKAQALEVLSGLALSVMANYASHITHPPLDAALEEHQ